MNPPACGPSTCEATSWSVSLSGSPTALPSHASRTQSSGFMRCRVSELPLRLGSRALRYQTALAARGAVDFAGRGPKPRFSRLRRSDRESGPPAVDPLARDASLARLEAVLFIAREPLSTRKLARLAHLADGTEARTLIRRLNSFYDEGQSAFRAEEVAGGFRLMSRPKFGAWLRRLHRSPVEMRLSGPAMETLAVVAYRQPALRAQIEAIRGVDCGEILRQLMERELVRIAGRSEDLGRPYLYGTTRRFLELFGLRDLDDLPRAEALRHNPEASRSELGASLNDKPGIGRALDDIPQSQREDQEETQRDHHRSV